MQVCFKYSASLYEGERWRWGGGKEEEAREKQELGTSAGQTKQKTTGGWRCCLWPLIQRRIKRRRRGRTEEPGSLVGWRWRGSPTAVDTQAQRRDRISAVAPYWQVYSPHVYIHAQTHTEILYLQVTHGGNPKVQQTWQRFEAQLSEGCVPAHPAAVYLQ